MDYICKPSFEQICGTKIAIAFWNQEEIVNRILALAPNVSRIQDRFFARDYIGRVSDYHSVELEVLENVSIFIQKPHIYIKNYIKLIGLEKLKWKITLKHYLFELLGNSVCEIFIRKGLHGIVWTLVGTVDEKKSAEVLVKDDSLDVVGRYELACVYCLEDYISRLYYQMPEDKRVNYHVPENVTADWRPNLINLWTSEITGQLNRFADAINAVDASNGPYRFGFMFAVYSNNKAAIHHIWPKLNAQNKVEILPPAVVLASNKHFDINTLGSGVYFPKESFGETMGFLLSKLDEERLKSVFKSKPHQILSCFLDWPSQCFFMDTLNQMWDFLTEGNIEVVMSFIRDKVNAGFTDYNYDQLIRDIQNSRPKKLPTEPE